jgi:hypothetical protein
VWFGVVVLVERRARRAVTGRRRADGGVGHAIAMVGRMLIFECYAVELAMCCNGSWFELGERLGAGLGARSFGAQAEIWPSSTSLQGSKIFLGRLQGSPTVHVSIFPSQTAAIKAIIELAGRCCKVEVPRLITGHQVWSHLTAQTSPWARLLLHCSLSRPYRLSFSAQSSTAVFP